MRKCIDFIFIICFTSNIMLLSQSNYTLKPSAFTIGCCEDLKSCLLAPTLSYNGGFVYPTAPFLTYTMFGQIFKEPVAHKVASIDTYFFLERRASSDNYNIYAHLYELDENNLPSQLLATSLPISTSNITYYSHHLNTFTFAESVEVPRNFAVVIDFSEVQIRNIIICVSTSPKGCYKEGEENYIIAHDERGWMPFMSSWNIQQKNLFNMAIFVNVEEPVNLKSQSKQTFIISPNPATDIIYIENAVESNLRMLDMTGKVVIKRSIQNISEAIEVNHLEKGIYFIEITKGGIKNVQKLIKR